MYLICTCLSSFPEAELPLPPPPAVEGDELGLLPPPPPGFGPDEPSWVPDTYLEKGTFVLLGLKDISIHGQVSGFFCFSLHLSIPKVFALPAKVGAYSVSPSPSFLMS